VKQVPVWTGELEDRPGAVAEKLAALSAAKANLEFVLARRAAETPGKAVLFLSPIRGAKQAAAASAAGLRQAENLLAVRVEGQDKPGLGARMTKALAEGGINLRGLSAAVIGKRFAVHLALDSATDAAKAVQLLKKLA